MTQPLLTVGLPSKGRLKDAFAEILQEARITVQRENRVDYGSLYAGLETDARIEGTFQRCGDSLRDMQEGMIDIAVVGLDKFEEVRCEARQNGDPMNIRIAGAFNVASCSMFIAAPEDSAIKKPQDLTGKRIATSYPYALKSWLEQNNVENVEILAREGGIEKYVRKGRADAVCDLVETGNTLKANGLEKRIKVFDSSAVLVERRGTWASEQQSQLATEIGARLMAAGKNLKGEQPLPALKRVPGVEAQEAAAALSL